MTPVRQKTPKRREITTVVSHWTKHKKDLRIDFNAYCAYCGSYDGYRHTYYEVDHFVPKSFFEPLGNIGLTQYDNLVYSCKFCNNNKKHKWPSQNEVVYHDGSQGFIDPCSEEYDDHLFRTDDGAIMWKTPLGKWMHNIAFKFDERERGLQLLWNLNKLRLIMKKLTIIQPKFEADNPNYLEIDKRLKSYSQTYVQYHIELMEYHS